MSDFFANLNFALSVTGPIILFLLLGIALKHWHIITEEFIDVGSRLVFNVTLPALLFITISQTQFSRAANFKLVAVGLAGTLILYFLMEIIVKYSVQPARDRGVVVQGGFRSNMGIIGLAYVVNAYGSEGLVLASLYLGLVTIFYNILAVITLSRSINYELHWSQTVKKIASNPLIIGILAGMPFAYFEIQIPGLFLKTGEYFAQMTLPLALLCTGGSLSLSVLRLESRNALIGTGCKILLAPLILTVIAYLAGFSGIQLGIVFLMSSSPTAAASYVMSRAMGANAALAANIIVLTTIGSVIATTTGITLLRFFDLV